MNIIDYHLFFIFLYMFYEILRQYTCLSVYLFVLNENMEYAYFQKNIPFFNNNIRHFLLFEIDEKVFEM